MVKPRKFNSGPDHLSCIEIGEDGGNVDDNVPDAHLFVVQMVDNYFAEIAHFLSTGVVPLQMIVV